MLLAERDCLIIFRTSYHSATGHGVKGHPGGFCFGIAAAQRDGSPTNIRGRYRREGWLAVIRGCLSSPPQSGTTAVYSNADEHHARWQIKGQQVKHSNAAFKSSVGHLIRLDLPWVVEVHPLRYTVERVPCLACLGLYRGGATRHMLKA